MFYRYEIKKINNEEVLFLFLTMSYEFSKELDEVNDEASLNKRCKNFIEDNKIKFKGTKVNLVIDDIIVKTLDIRNIDNEIEHLETKETNLNNETLVSIILDNKVSVEITLREYLLGVLASNSLEHLEEETLKALCILFRTFAYIHLSKNKSIPATNNFILYRPITYYKLLWITQYNDIYNKYLNVIEKTDKEFISYQGNYILPFTHICNNGYTDINENYPYLTKVNSLWDMASPYYLTVTDFDYKTLEKSLNIKSKNFKNISIVDTTSTNRIKNFKIGDKIFNAEDLCKKLNLNSSDITLIINRDYIRFITKGKGNCLGLSQFGANELSLNGCSYIQILKYYFPTCEVRKYK